MKIRLLLALVGLAFSFALPTFAQQTNKPDPQLRQRLIALVNKHAEAYNKNDAAGVAAAFTDDGVYVPETGPVTGRPAIEKYWADLFKQFHLSNEILTVDEDSPHIIGTAGNAIWATGGWSATIQGKDWGPNDIKGFYSVIREGDDWKIRNLTFNFTPAPPATGAATQSPTTTPSSQ